MPDNPANIVKIIVMCPGETKNDKLTDLGKRQSKAAVAALISADFDFHRIVYSAMAISEECAKIARDLLLENNNLVHYDPNIIGLGFEKSFTQAFGSNMAMFTAEIYIIETSNNTVANALGVSNYARLGKAQLTACLLDLARKMLIREETDVLCFGCTPFHTLAALDPSTLYKTTEASAVIYTIQDGRIIGSRLVSAPYVE